MGYKLISKATKEAIYSFIVDYPRSNFPSYKDIAERFGVSLGTVGILIRGLRRLKKPSRSILIGKVERKRLKRLSTTRKG